MTWLVWNVRGINKWHKQKELKLILKSRKIKFVGLVETRVKKHNQSKVCNNILPRWGMITNYQHSTNGRICVAWDPSIYRVTTIASTSQTIHCTIEEIVGNLSCDCNIVYGFNSIELRKPLWEELRKLTQYINKLWLVCGDFNVVLHLSDRIFGNPVILTEIKGYAECLHDIMVDELPWKGEYYTWTNKQLGSARICSRIDRAFGNHDWMMQWGQIQIEYYLPHLSDHTPMMFTMTGIQHRVKASFKFFNV